MRRATFTRCFRSKHLCGWPGAIVLLLVFFTLAVTSAARKSNAFDEIIHLPGGYAIWALCDYRMAVNADGGILPKAWAALPLLRRDTKWADTDQEAWLESDQWEIGRRFFFDAGNDARSLLRPATIMMALLTCLIGALIYWAGRSTFGRTAGFIAVALFTFSPVILAHGRLVTSDMAAAGAFLLAAVCFWRALERLTVGRVLCALLAIALAAVTKNSLALLAPMYLLLVVIRVASRRPMRARIGKKRAMIRTRARVAGVAAGLMVLSVGSAWFGIWAGFGFRYSMYRAEDRAESRFMLVEGREEEAGGAFGLIEFCREHRLLPEGYLTGMTHLLITRERGSFMNGRTYADGTPWFFPFVVAVKTPLPTLLLAALAIAGGVIGAAPVRKRFPFFGVQLRKPLPHGRGSERRGMLARLGLHFYRAAPLWVIFIAYWIIAITSSINIGHRHLLPVYPPAFMLIGAGAAWWIRWAGRAFVSDGRLRLRERGLRSILAKPQAAAVVVFGLTGLLAIESVVTWPHYLSYFNQLAGGSRNGYRLLVDSSLDWGQDLPDLRRRIEAFRADPARAGREVYVAYYGSAGLDYWSIDATVIATWPAQREIPSLVPPLGAGMYAISATLLQGGPRWSEERDQQYVESERLWRLAMAAQTDPAAREAYEEMVRVHGREAVEQGLAGHRDLRFARLRAWLRSHRPDSFAGYSILIFDLDNREIEAALYGPIASEPRP